MYVCVGFVMCGCFGNMCTCIYCVLYFFVLCFLLFRLCVFILICFVCTSVRTTATEWKKKINNNTYGYLLSQASSSRYFSWNSSDSDPQALSFTLQYFPYYVWCSIIIIIIIIIIITFLSCHLRCKKYPEFRLRYFGFLTSCSKILLEMDAACFSETSYPISRRFMSDHTSLPNAPSSHPANQIAAHGLSLFAMLT